MATRKCPWCGEPCAHGFCGRCEKVLPAAPTPAPTREDEMAQIERAVRWLMGEEGEFTTARVFRGKTPPYWWRSEFMAMLPERFHLAALSSPVGETPEGK